MREGKRLNTALQCADIFPNRPPLLHGVTDKRLDHSQDVLDAMVQLLVQHPLAHIRLAALIGKQFVYDARQSRPKTARIASAISRSLSVQRCAFMRTVSFQIAKLLRGVRRSPSGPVS